MRGSYLPRPGDHFPALQRGHGRGLGKRVKDPSYPKGFRTSKEDCVAAGCRGLHIDQEANVELWRTERRLAAVPW